MSSFCLSLPPALHQEVRALCAKRAMTMTSYIRGAVAARVQADITGQRHCSDGNPCILALLPQFQNLTAGARLLITDKFNTKSC